MRAMTEENAPYILLTNLSSAILDDQSQTYDVTHLTKGMFYDIFMVLQEMLNFTATLHKRKDSQWGMVNILANGTISTTGILESVTSGFAEMIVSR